VEESLKRIKELEKRVAVLEGQVQAQKIVPEVVENIGSEILRKTYLYESNQA
jgi:predicted fused transcriptional regulator/phosphomethylpyrimidine kinase